MPDTLGADGGIANDWKRGMMFDKRLFSLADGVGRLIAAKVACQWLGLVANIAFVVAVVRMLQPLFAPVPSATAPCIAIILIAAVVRFVTIRAAARFGSEAAERVKLALREKLFNKMLALGPSYAQRVRTAGVVQSAGEGIEQIQSFFELFLPQLCYAVLAPITLFAVLASIDLPTAATLLACAPLIVLIVGMTIGSIAGYCGGKVDLFIMRIVDIIYSLPDMLMVILLASVLKVAIGNSLEGTVLEQIGSNIISLFIVFGVLYWVSMSRLIRGQILSLKEQEYVLAAQATGASGRWIITRHLIPNCISVIIISTALQIPNAIFTESFLSFLGLGVNAPMPSLGSLASDALNGISSYPYRMVIPAVVISLIVLSLNLFGDGLRDAFDPKLNG